MLEEGIAVEFMGRSQETFLKKQREKDRSQKKKAKKEKRDQRRDSDSIGLEIDWSSAPENKTLSQTEEVQKMANKANNINNNQ